MRTTRNIFGHLALGLAAFALASCSSPKTESSQRLGQAISKAQLLCKHAAALMSNVSFEYAPQGKASQLAPLAEPIRRVDLSAFLKTTAAAPSVEEFDKATADIQVQPLDTVHPKASAALKQAQTELDEAIAKNPEASDAVKGLAKLAQAQIMAMQAQVSYSLAIAQANKVSPAMDAAWSKLDAARTLATSVQTRAQLAAMGDKELRDLSAKATADLAALNADVQKKEGEVAALSKQVETMTTQVTAQQTQVADLERQVREAVGKAAEELSDKLVALRQDMYENIAKAQDMERVQLQALKDDLSVLSARSAGVKGRADAAEAALKDRAGQVDKAKTDVAAAQAELKKNVEAAVPMLKDALAARQESLQNAKDALTRLDLAARKADEANNPRDARVLAFRASVGMDIGAINRQMALDAQRMKGYWESLQATWATSAGGSTLGSGVELPSLPAEDPAAYTKAATDAFKAAATGYNQATNCPSSDSDSDAAKIARQNARWAFQFAEARAHRALASVSDADAASAISSAESLEKSAKQGREASPYLHDLDASDTPK